MWTRTLKVLAAACLSGALMACSGPSTKRMPDKVKDASDNPKPTTPLPSWAKGEYPSERAFFGHGEGPLSGGEEAARAQAVKTLKLELALLTRGIKIDHEEQVAEVISRYPPSEFNAHVDAVVDVAVEKAEVRERHTSDSRGKLYVLYTLSIEAFYDALYAREGLPEEQNTRVRNYSDTFTDAAMLNLSRMEEE